MENEDDILASILSPEETPEAEAAEAEGSAFSPLTEDEIHGIVSTAINDAVDFIASEIAEPRIKAQRYFDGEVDLGYETGRSKVVATKARDTVRAIKPSLMRVFLSTARPVEFVPTGPEDVAFAEQATQFINWRFGEMGGYRILSDAFHDALIKKTGIVKAYAEQKDCSKVYTFTGLNDMQYQAIVSDPDVEVIEHSVEQEEMGEMTPEMQSMQATSEHDLKIIRRQTETKIRAESVPPEEFFIDRNARSIDECYVCGHRTDMRAADVIAMGYDEDVVLALDATADAIDSVAEEDAVRRGYYRNQREDESALDPAMRNVLITEAYLRIDVDGTGTPLLHRVVCGGTSYKILSYEPADEIPFAVFEVDPEPHAFFGRSVVDLVLEDQDAATAILRGILDNVAMTNNPRIGVVEGQVNIDDVLNNEIGAVIRQRAPGMVQPYEVPFTAGQTMGALQYMDQLVEQKTGVTRASMGLDPDAMQSTTKAAVTATMQAAAGQVETIARNLAESGMRRLFSLLLRLYVKHCDAEEMMRMNGQYQPVDPRVWNTSMDVSVNIGLGTGREEEKAMAYREVLGLQMQIWQGYGPANGLVSLTSIRNTLGDMLASAGIRNSERYFAPMDPQREQMMQQQAAQAAQQQPQASDPNAAFLQAEQMKTSARVQADMAKLQLDAQRMMMDDDRQRDQMTQDLALKAAELLAKTGVQIDQNAIKREQAMTPRPVLMGQGQPQQRGM